MLYILFGFINLSTVLMCTEIVHKSLCTVACVLLPSLFQYVLYQNKTANFHSASYILNSMCCPL